MAFKGKPPEERVPESPEHLFRELPRSPEGSESLWLHQGDVLRAYTGRYEPMPDLAIELPTGTGKTLPGLVLAEWNRRKRRTPVAFACPTRQLARQTLAAAEREGFRPVLLIGSHHDWESRDSLQYASAKAIAVTTYNTIFNSSPKLDEPGVIVFDDAHAGEQYVASQYTIVVRRSDEADYERVLNAVTAGLDGTQAQRYAETTPDAQITKSLNLVLPCRNLGMKERLHEALGELEGDNRFTYSMIRSGLAACLVHVSYGAISVRPLIPPTSENAPFTNAAQRIYLSATLGEGGELERAFGRAPITRLELPSESAAPRAGRRFFVLPQLSNPDSIEAVVTDLIATADKALLLTQDQKSADRLADRVKPGGFQVFKRAAIEDGFDEFKAADRAVCALANRYDGIDLPGDACRMVVLAGLPDADSLHERFLAQRARVGVALAQRIRTRVIQGFGRCTRGPSDWAVVVLLGEDLVKYVLKPTFLDALDDEIRAEIQFGYTSGEVETEELLHNVRSFVAQDDEWRGDGEDALNSCRTGQPAASPEGAVEVGSVVEDEIKACELAWRGHWRRAGDVLDRATLKLGSTAAQPYRAFLQYLAAVWLDHAGEIEDDAGSRASARQMVRNAERSAEPARWVSEMAPLPGDDRDQLGPTDASAVATITRVLVDNLRTKKFESQVQSVRTGLAQTDAEPYERALTDLGLLLGAEAWKPAEQGRCDSVWCWENYLWIALDAKSEHQTKGLVPEKDIRQSNVQLRRLAADRSADVPAGSVSLMVSPKPAVDPVIAVSAELHVHLVDPSTVEALGADALAAWDGLLAKRHVKDDAQVRASVIGALSRHGCLPSQVVERLSQNPVNA